MSTKLQMESKFRSRKWLGMVSLLLTATALLVVNKITGELWVEVVTWVYGLFAGANVASSGVKKVKEDQFE